MDYTRIHPALIYKPKSYEEFAKISKFNERILDCLFEEYFQYSSNAENAMLRCLNAAYNIVTIILPDSKPVWRIQEYKIIAERMAKNGQIDAVNIVFHIVIILLDKIGLSTDSKYHNLFMKLREYCKPYNVEFVTRLLKDNDEKLSLENFALCDVDNEAIHIVNEDPHYNWREITNDYDETKIKKILKAVKQTSHNLYIIIDAIADDVEIYCDSKRKPKLLSFLDFIKREVYQKYDAEIDKVMAKAELEDLAKCSDYVNELEQEIANLRAKVAEMEPSCYWNYGEDKNEQDVDNNQHINQISSESISELQQQLEAAKKKIEEQDAIITELKENLKNIKNGDPRIKKENERLISEKEEMIVELLTPICYNQEEVAKEFLNEIQDLKDSEIADIVVKWTKDRKISDRSNNRPLWRILHAAKLYESTESNWNTALKRR